MSNTLRLSGHRVWLLVSENDLRPRWADALGAALRGAGCDSFDIVSVGDAVSLTAKSRLQSGAEKIARLVGVHSSAPGAEFSVDIAQARPTLLLVTTAQLARAANILRVAANSEARVVAIVPDFYPQLEWRAEDLHGAIAPDLSALPIGARNFAIAGPPLPSRVANRTAEQVREELGFPDDPVLLVDLAGSTSEEIERVVDELAGVPAHLVFRHGNVSPVAESLRRAASARGVKARMFGDADSLFDFGLAADGVIAGSSNPNIAEYIASGRPLWTLDGRLSASMLVQGGRLRVVPFGAGLRPEILALTRCSAVPSGATPCADVADALATVLEAASSPPVQAPSAATVSPRASRFETIGEVTQAPAPLSREEAKQRLAALILEERKIEADVGELGRGRDRWMNRLALAEDAKQSDLVAVAAENVQRATQAISRMNERAAAIGVEKDQIRRRVADSGVRAAPTSAPGDGAAEARFRELERASTIDQLRKKSGDGA